ncbi:MAG: 1,4-dihydroxy-2-naphthoate octaprenyltransferase [Puniceicoccales bacterium]|jgi:1,4-dihydroxy-2-naphthoate octaprenyltransferase|nr:1,4-dihydroxy-2-naphthoate octaprenyltransferase [Puniceicoccales bacterium]
MRTVSKGTIGAWVAACRPKTLAAAAAPIAVGTAAGWRHAGGGVDAIRWDLAASALVFALLTQITCNISNDLGDFLRGADTPRRVGPARMAATGALTPGQLRLGAAVCALAAFAAGLPLAIARGWWLVMVGAPSLLAAFAYTNGPFPLAYKGLGDAFVLIFFGFVATLFSAHAQCGCLPVAAWVGGGACGLLAVNILLVNNTRDMETDAAAGKRTTVVRLGRGFARDFYTLNVLLAVGVPILFLLWEARAAGFLDVVMGMKDAPPAFGSRPPWPVLLLLPSAPLAWWVARKFRGVPDATPAAYNPVLGKSALLLLLHAAFLTIAIAAS